MYLKFIFVYLVTSVTVSGKSVAKSGQQNKCSYCRRNLPWRMHAGPARAELYDETVTLKYTRRLRGDLRLLPLKHTSLST